jgi:MFS family permease
MQQHMEEDEEEYVPARPSRAVMYTLVSLQGLPNWVIRNGSEWPCACLHAVCPSFVAALTVVGRTVRPRGSAPSWIPFVVADMGLSDADRALLLAAWFPGYLVSQIPGAALIDRIGPKIVMGANMLGTCGLFMLLPVFVRLGGGGQISRQVRIMASTLTLCGFFQGPLIPGQQVMRYEPFACAGQLCTP